MDWLDLLAVQGTLKNLLQHHSSKASILRRSAFFIAQLSHPYMTTGKTIALTRRTFVGKVMPLLPKLWPLLKISRGITAPDGECSVFLPGHHVQDRLQNSLRAWLASLGQGYRVGELSEE